MGFIAKCETALVKHHYPVSMFVLAISFIMVFNLITPTMLLAVEITPNMTTDTPDVIRPVRTSATVPANLREEISQNENKIRSLRSVMQTYAKDGIRISPSTTIKFNRASALITSLRISSSTKEKMEAKKEELKNLVASLQADQQRMVALRESIKRSTDLLNQANMTIAGMRNSLNRTRAFAKTDNARAQAELVIFSEKAKQLSIIAGKLADIEKIKADLSKLPTSTLNYPRIEGEHRPATGTFEGSERREENRPSSTLPLPPVQNATSSQ